MQIGASSSSNLAPLGTIEDPEPQTQRKERDKIELGPLPSVAEFEIWKMSTKLTISVASAHPPECMLWFTQCERAKSWEALTAIPRRFSQLEGKISEALAKLISGETGSIVVCLKLPFGEIGIANFAEMLSSMFGVF